MDIYNAGNRVMNTYVYHALSGYIMIDTGYEHSFRNVERRLNKQGIALSDVKYVFLTHVHDDHAGFLNELLSKYVHIKVIVSDKAMPALLRGQNSFAGGCSGGKEKIVFEKRFPKVCGCTFRIDNAKQKDIPFLKTIVDLRIKEIKYGG